MNENKNKSGFDNKSTHREFHRRILLLATVFLLLLILPPDVRAETKSTESDSTAEAVHIELAGEFRSTSQPDGTDIMTCTGGIRVYQKLLDENALLELQAENAVFFYSQKELLKQFDKKTETTPEKKPSSDKKYPQAVYLEGDVILQIDRLEYASDTKVTAERLYYDFIDKTAIILDGTLRLRMPENNMPLYVRAQRIRQLSQDHYIAEHVKFSNDEFYQPHFWLGVKKLDIALIEPQKQIDSSKKSPRRYRYDLKNVTLNLEDMPIFWWPRGLGTSGKTESPIQSLHTSVSSEYGLSLESQLNPAWLLGLPEPAGVDSVLHLDEFSKRGPGAGLDLDYTSDSYFGSLRTYLLNDNGEDRLGRLDSRKDVHIDHSTRGRARWQHRQFLPQNWEGTFEISYLSDRNFLESWHEREFDTEKEQETLVYFKQQRDNWAFDFTNKFHLNDFDYTLTELPGAGLHGAGQDLFNTLTYYHDSYISRQAQRAGAREVCGFGWSEEPGILPDSIDQDDFAFALSRHELNLPFHFGSWHLVPTIIGTFVHDESRFDDFLIDDPRYSRPRNRNSFVHGAAGLRAGTHFWRIDDSVRSRLWNLNRLRHVVSPEVSAFWIDSDLSEDQIRRNVFNFALRQRWQTMRGPEEKKHSVDFLRLNTSVTLVSDDVDDASLPGSFFFDRPDGQFDTPAVLNHDLANLGLARREQFNQNLSDHADADWTWLISDTTAFTGAFNYNIHDSVISQTAAAIAVRRSPRTRYYVGHRFLRNGDPFYNRDAQFLTAGASYRINRKYTLALTQQYDIEQTASAYTRATVIRRFPHWFGAFSVSHDSTRGGVSFILSFWPEGFDQFVLGSRRFTRLAP